MTLLRIIGICLLFVSIANDSYKLLPVIPVGFPIIFLIIILPIFYVVAGVQIKLRNLFILVIFVVYFLYGIAVNELYFVLQDFLPLISFTLICTANVKLDNEQIVYCLRSYTRICLIIITTKIFYVIYFRPEMAWGELFLAVNYDFSSTIPRIIFKGVEPILMLALFLELASVSCNKTRNIFYVALAIILIIFNGSKPLILSAIIYLFIFEFLITHKHNKRKIILGALFLLLMLSTYFLTLDNNFFRSNDKYESIHVFGLTLDNVSISLSYRIHESLAAIASVNNWIIGDGLGKSFIAPSSGATSEDGTSPFAHSLAAWVFIKSGLLGLAILLGIIYNCVANFLKEILTSRSKSNKLNLITKVFLLLFIFSSFITNQATTFTGGVLLGILSLILFNSSNKDVILQKRLQ